MDRITKNQVVGCITILFLGAGVITCVGAFLIWFGLMLARVLGV